jgi:hypothetical protein
MRRVTSDRSIVGKLTVNLGAAIDAATVSNTAAGGITVDGNPLASQQARRFPGSLGTDGRGAWYPFLARRMFNSVGRATSPQVTSGFSAPST